MDCIIIDGSNLMYAMFHGMPDMVNKKGRHVNAIVGFASKLIAFEEMYPNIQKIVVFDMFPELSDVQKKVQDVPLTDSVQSRKDLYQDYKGDRPDVPEFLKQQIKGCASVAKNLGWSVFVVGEPLEADDVIFSLSQRYGDAGYQTIVASNDKDLIQSKQHPNVHIWQFKEKEKPLISNEFIYEKFGVEPHKMSLSLALKGDKVDGVPGLPGCGPVTVTKLCDVFNSIDDIIDAAENNTHPDIISKSLRAKIINHKDDLKVYEILTKLNNLPIQIENIPKSEPLYMHQTLEDVLNFFEIPSIQKKINNLINAREMQPGPSL